MIFPFSDFALETYESRGPINIMITTDRIVYIYSVMITDSNDSVDYIIIINVIGYQLFHLGKFGTLALAEILKVVKTPES